MQHPEEQRDRKTESATANLQKPVRSAKPRCAPAEAPRRRRTQPPQPCDMAQTALTEKTSARMHDAATETWLSPAQMKTWGSDGMLVLPGMFSEEELVTMRAEADRILEEQISSSLYHGRRSGRLDWRMREDGKQLVRKIQPINDMSLTFATFSDDPRMKGPLAELMGEPAILFEEK